MAIVFTSKDVPSRQFAVTASNSDAGIGVDMPIGKSDSGIFFKQTYTTLTAAKANIKNLILTSRGERVMHPSLGTGLWNLIMEPMENSELEHAIDTTIRENVKMWLPYIDISELHVTPDYDNNTVDIGMTISLKNDPQAKETIYFSISKGDK